MIPNEERGVFFVHKLQKHVKERHASMNPGSGVQGHAIVYTTHCLTLKPKSAITDTSVSRECTALPAETVPPSHLSLGVY